jgi:hypothetical protein
MRTLLALLAAGASLLLVGSASALTIDAEDPTTLVPHDGSLDLNVVVTATCQEILLGGASLTVALGATGAPSWLGVTGSTVDFSLTECGATVNVVKNGTVTLTPAADAIGLQPVSLTVTANTDAATDPVSGVMVSYRPGHQISPSGDQTFRVTDATYPFNVSIAVQANARTMVMFTEKVVNGTGVLTGLRDHTFDVAAGETTLVLPVTFTAPTGKWSTNTVTFTNFSHCLEHDSCSQPTMMKNITWTFTGLLLVVMALGVVLLRRRG